MFSQLAPEEVHKCIETYAVFVLCQTLGDSGSYYRFIQRQKEEGDNDAIQMLASIDKVEQIKEDVKEFSEIMASFGKGRLDALVTHVVSAPVCSFPECDMWSLCNVTGKPVSRSILVGHMHVDITYKPFVYALWVVSHAKEFVMSVIESFLQTVERNLKRGAIILKYKEDVKEDVYKVYYESYAHVSATFRLSLEALKQSHSIPS